MAKKQNAAENKRNQKSTPAPKKKANVKKPAVDARVKGTEAAVTKKETADQGGAKTPQLQGEQTAKRDECVVVGLGASAGGLEAFKRFLNALPADSGMAFVLVQHLDPNHQSLMANLLSKYTSMPVVQVEEPTAVNPNHVYMIPPNKYIKIHVGGLFLDEPVKDRGIRMPIDYFFRSLAEARAERGVCVVLSGTGTDGTLGLKVVKAAGGMTMAQKPDTADYDGMPRSAVSSGMVDFILSIEDMPEILAKYSRHPYILTGGEKAHLYEASPDHFKSILSLLKAHTDYDFRCYKKGTLNRRIQRRMGLRHVDRLGDYLQLLRNDSTEVRALFKDLLISVPTFSGRRKLGLRWKTKSSPRSSPKRNSISLFAFGSPAAPPARRCTALPFCSTNSSNGRKRTWTCNGSVRIWTTKRSPSPGRVNTRRARRRTCPHRG